MASHKDIWARNRAHDDRTVHLGGLQFKMSREEIAAVIASHGFHDCVFYWPPKPAQHQNHTGWCFVEFANATRANSARQQLNGAKFGGRPVKAGKPSKAPGRAPSGQTNLSSSAGKSQANIQNPEATVAAAEVGDEAQPTVKREITCFVHPFSASPTAQAKLDFEATRLDSYREAWGVKKDTPLGDDRARQAIHDRCMKLDEVYMAAGVRSGFPFARIIDTKIPHPDDPDQNPRVVDNSGLLARQFPNPAPENDEMAESMPVLMIKKRVADEDPCAPRSTPKRPDVKLAPAHDVEAHMVDEWYPYVQRIPDEAEVDKTCDRIVDVKTTDQPWKDTERQFELGIAATNFAAVSKWFPGAVLDRPVVNGVPQENLSWCAVGCISNAPEFRNQGQSGADMRTATSGGHDFIIKRPQDVGLGWGGYDDFHQWQANGRKISPGDVEKRDWQFDVRKMVVVEEGSGKETTFDVAKETALDFQIGVAQNGEGVFPTDLKSLHAVLNPGKRPEKRYTGGRGGGEW